MKYILMAALSLLILSTNAEAKGEREPSNELACTNATKQYKACKLFDLKLSDEENRCETALDTAEKKSSCSGS